MGVTVHAMFRDGQMRAAMDAEAQAHAAHARNNAWQGLRAPAGFARVERYQTADPTLSLATVQDGRPVYDFAAAPSLFVEEDLRQEKHMLEHRKNTCEPLKALLPESVPPPLMPQKLVGSRFALSSNAPPSRPHAPMPKPPLVLPSTALTNSVTC